LSFEGLRVLQTNLPTTFSQFRLKIPRLPLKRKANHIGWLIFDFSQWSSMQAPWVMALIPSAAGPELGQGPQG
jgi:hypothetical protein